MFCFASGAEIGPHKNDHSYKFVEQCVVSMFGGRRSWTGQEEIQLLEALELYGFGDWEFISKHIETRTPDEVKEEYVARYVDGNIGKATWTEVADCRPCIIDQTPEDVGPLAPAIISRLSPLDVTPEEARQLGYMLHRDDYDREHDMAAEQLITSLQLNIAEDSDTEIMLKLAQVGIYIKRLRERSKRKRMVRDYQLVAKFFSNEQKDMQKPLIKEQKDLYDKLRVFSQFFTANEKERLLTSLEREKELKFRLSELIRYRRLGLTTQDEAIHYEQHAAFEQQNRQCTAQWLCNSNSQKPIKKRRKRGKSKFHRPKVHVASKRRISKRL